MNQLSQIFQASSKNANIGGVVPSFLPYLLAKIKRADKDGAPLLFIAHDDRSIEDIAENLKFYAPEVQVISFMGWDCLPYDRVGPSSLINNKRLHTLAKLLVYNLREADERKPLVVLTTVSAIMQKIISPEILRKQITRVVVGQIIDMEALVDKLNLAGYQRTSIVQDCGEYAIRGGLLDIYPSTVKDPIRLDFFGQKIESIRSFDVGSQKTISAKKSFTLLPISEIRLNNASIDCFRQNFVRQFGSKGSKSLLYETITSGKNFIGMEHYLPCFYPQLSSLFDYLPEAIVVFDHLTDQAIVERWKLIEDYYKSRCEQQQNSTEDDVYFALPPGELYINPQYMLSSCSSCSKLIKLSSFSGIDNEREGLVINYSVQSVKNFTKERKSVEHNLIDEVLNYLIEQKKQGRKIVICCNSEGSRHRLKQIFSEHGLQNISEVQNIDQLEDGEKTTIKSAVLLIDSGFIYDDILFIGEKDIFGESLVTSSKKRRKAANYIMSSNSLAPKDIVVHVNHGIGRFVGLRTIEALGVKHDCLEVHYAGDDRLFIPVENVDLLSRYGGDSTTVALDRLGGTAWQARKSKLKKRLLEIAGSLIDIAAQRKLKTAPIMSVQPGEYEEFVARFPYEETEDQANSISDVIEDLKSGKPMDRLICGDVGFGKTEVCLRAAFVAAMNGYQVAVIVPTTLLCRQHYKNFKARFSGFPVDVRQSSRLVSAKELKEVKKGLKNASVDIVIGTHSLLSSNIEFSNLGLLIIDEEHHFGVKHKEKLKSLKSDVHILTLSATPIPRTLQSSFVGIRELSMIVTPPVDRLAVRSFVMPFDSLTIRESLLREHYRGGQSFFICPRISDLDKMQEFLSNVVPELRVAIAHGQMPPGQLDEITNSFYDGKYDVLLSTSIIESGIDIPTANTIIIYRAEMFGLAALYQLRGRVGRAKERAYAIFTFPSDKMLTKEADRRLQILQSIEGLGGGFQLANHDMDIRGAGNLLGEEQSGHIKEVGYELYQQMLEEAIVQLRDKVEIVEEKWSPQINIGSSVLIAESYISDLTLRLSLYRRLSELDNLEDIQNFGSEMIDRFGKYPEETENLLKVMYVKSLCKKANVEKLDAGENGVLLVFYKNKFANPARLLDYLTSLGSNAVLRADQSIFFLSDGSSISKRLNSSVKILKKLISFIEL